MYLPVTSTEDILIPATGDATGLPVKVAFVLNSEEREPTEVEYHDAAWEGTDIVLLVGPDSTVVLAEGEYDVWVQVTGVSPRKPVRRSGLLTVGGT